MKECGFFDRIFRKTGYLTDAYIYQCNGQSLIMELKSMDRQRIFFFKFYNDDILKERFKFQRIKLKNGVAQN